MKFATTIVLSFLLAVTGICTAQSMDNVLDFLTPDIKEYIQLSKDQIAQINKSDTDLYNYFDSSSIRYYELDDLIASIKADPKLDGLAAANKITPLLAEQLSMDRELTKRVNETAKANKAVLTPAQKVMLSTLIEAYNLQSKIEDAFNAVLLIDSDVNGGPSSQVIPTKAPVAQLMAKIRAMKLKQRSFKTQ